MDQELHDAYRVITLEVMMARLASIIFIHERKKPWHPPSGASSISSQSVPKPNASRNDTAQIHRALFGRTAPRGEALDLRNRARDQSSPETGLVYAWRNIKFVREPS